LNNNQKLFELGEDSTVGVITWGLGGLMNASYRTLLAILADDIKNNPPASLEEIVGRWKQQFWTAYSTDPLLILYRGLDQKPTHDPANPLSRTVEEENQYRRFKESLVVGFCIAGYWQRLRTPAAYSLLFDPTATSPPAETKIAVNAYCFWGVPNMMKRLIWGVDDNLKHNILKSGMWTGTGADFDALAAQSFLGHPILPIRDAVDFVHSCIFSTIKAMKFSQFSQVCGGPIELAVITSDRKLRWVRHKPWDAALMEGAT
jgi:hypothetical protein